MILSNSAGCINTRPLNLCSWALQRMLTCGVGRALQDDLYSILPVLSILELVIILIYLGHISGCFFYLFSTPPWQTTRKCCLWTSEYARVIGPVNSPCHVHPTKPTAQPGKMGIAPIGGFYQTSCACVGCSTLWLVAATMACCCVCMQMRKP